MPPSGKLHEYVGVVVATAKVRDSLDHGLPCRRCSDVVEPRPLHVTWATRKAPTVTLRSLSVVPEQVQAQVQVPGKALHPTVQAPLREWHRGRSDRFDPWPRRKARRLAQQTPQCRVPRRSTLQHQRHHPRPQPHQSRRLARVVQVGGCSADVVVQVGSHHQHAQSQSQVALRHHLRQYLVAVAAELLA